MSFNYKKTTGGKQYWQAKQAYWPDFDPNYIPP